MIDLEKLSEAAAQWQALPQLKREFVIGALMDRESSCRVTASAQGEKGLNVLAEAVLESANACHMARLCLMALSKAEKTEET